MKKLFYWLLPGVLFLGIVWSYRTFVSSVRYPADPGSNERVIFQVAPGMSAAEVARGLEEKGLIKTAAALTFYLKREGLGEKIKAGAFVLSPGQSPAQIAEALAAGRSQELSVTLLEGWTAAQMAEFLETLELTTREKFMDCLKNCSFDFDFFRSDSPEGYLYPDTYFVDPSAFSEEGFIRRLLQTFRNKLDDDWSAIQKSSRTLEQIVIMASIVEREERDSAERPRVAGILWKRFDAGRGLDADATILYALGRTSGGLSYQDLQVSSPHNTRKYRGLPPGPISNPSLNSLRAALYPETTPYWYYLHDSEGQVHYGKTLEEHNENKAKYL